MIFIKEKIRFIIVAAGILTVLFPCMVAGATAKDNYFEAEDCYKSLRQNPNKVKYHTNWMRCIDKFQKVYIEIVQCKDSEWQS